MPPYVSEIMRFIPHRRRCVFRLLALVGLVWLIITTLSVYMGSLPPQEHTEGKKQLFFHLQELFRDEGDPRGDTGRGAVGADDPQQQQEQQRKLDQKQQAELDAHDVAKPPRPLKPKPTNNPNNPGELGKPVIIDPKKLSSEERMKYDRGWQLYNFNEYVGQKIALNRSLIDPRDAACLRKTYPKDLPQTSIIIIFHNEAWSALLRTVHSVIDRSPPHLIKEIVLVDDFSTLPHLQKPLEDYVRPFGKIRIVRSKRREGLIRARLLGASVAIGKVLTFLDSHCECADGWLEPLLARIHQNESNVVCPVCDSIDYQTLQYNWTSAKNTWLAVFGWDLNFVWSHIPERIRRSLKQDIDPLPSPSMVGGQFSVSKKYFEHIGTYDSGMEIWGAQNMEISVRVWMCGGRVEILPCSHVGHLLRPVSRYYHGPHNKRNSVRFAEVWLDDYKKYYYKHINYNLGNYGDVSARKALRKRLKCHSFQWYMDNVNFRLFDPSRAVRIGGIRSKTGSKCIDAPSQERQSVKTWSCHGQGGNQQWFLSKNGEIRRENMCMDYPGYGEIIVFPCHGSKGPQHWIYTKSGHIRQAYYNFCIEISSDGNSLLKATCSDTDRQVWLWKANTKL